MVETRTPALHHDKTHRHSNLELLRIVATLLVIVLHYNHAGMGKGFFYTASMPVHYQILLFIEMMAICATNVFVMISGYFLCQATKVSIYKIIKIYVDVIIFFALRYIASCLLGDEGFVLRSLFGRSIPANWYVAVYSGLYLLSPYLNRMLSGLNKSQFRFMLLVFFFVLSVWPVGIDLMGRIFGFSLNSLTPISMDGYGGGYTLVNFVLLYLFGAYCRMHESVDRSRKKGICAILVYLGATVTNAVYAHFYYGPSIAYCNPLVIIQTVSLFIVFENISIQSKMVNTIAGCSFGVYLTHGFFFRFCNIERSVTGSPWMIPVHVIGCAIMIYAVAGAIYWAYQKAFHPVFSYLQKKLRFLTYDINGLL